MSAAIQHNSSAWTESLPSGWRWDRLSKTAEVIVSNVDKKTEDGEEAVLLCNYVDVYKNDKITAEIAFMEASATPHEIDRFTIRRGDVLATKDSENPLDIAISATVADDLEGVLCGYHLAIMRADNRRLFGPYLGWLHVSKTIRAHYEMHATGITRWAVGRQHFKTCPIPLPPLPEQERIAAYLDASCAAIDWALATKQQQLETIAALRKSIIQKAVTEGLNADVEMKDSGVNWLGPIPKHWRVQKLKRVFADVEYGISESTEEEGNYAVLKMGNIVKGEIALTKIEYVAEVDEALMLDTNDLLFNRTNSLDQVAKVGIFRGTKQDSVTYASYLVRLRTTRRNHPEFINYLVNADIFLGLARKMAIPSVQQANLNPTRYCRLEIPVPPLDEQMLIAQHLQEKCAQLGEIEMPLSSQIETLTAYRKSLIHECVTGQRRITDEDVAHAQSHV